MREIVFRAKRKNNRGWICGSLVKKVGGVHIISESITGGIADYTEHEVDPETVCQYTGLTDKNGRKIFENDIVKLEDYHGHRTVYIFYGEDCGCWFYGGDGFSDEYIFNGQQKEVIGNYFDDEDLLGDQP